MNNISLYISEKLHIGKDSKYFDKDIKEGDNVLYFMISDNFVDDDYNFVIDYCNITKLDNKDNILWCDSLLDEEENYTIANLKKNSKDIYEEYYTWRDINENNVGVNTIILKRKDAIDFIDTILEASDYKKIDYSRWIDNKIFMPDKISINKEVEDLQEIKDKIQHEND